MNGSVLSNLRYDPKEKVVAKNRDGEKLSFSKIATYLRERDYPNT